VRPGPCHDAQAGLAFGATNMGRAAQPDAALGVLWLKLTIL
jgi:hypothetical protein